MSILNQRTIKSKLTLKGIGLHTGKNVEYVLREVSTLAFKTVRFVEYVFPHAPFEAYAKNNVCAIKLSLATILQTRHYLRIISL